MVSFLVSSRSKYNSTMKDNKIIAAVIVGLSLILFGFILRSGIIRFIDKDRQVTVKGLSEREVPANKITWKLSTYVTGDALPTLYNDIQKTNQVVVDFLKSNGLSESEISILPPEVDDRISNRWSNEYIPFNYKLTTPITITSSNVDLVKDIVMIKLTIIFYTITFRIKIIIHFTL